ncbi:MAG TPA: hypothetical protein VHE34_26720 [Puia sp.]|uniref:hypothetical protein n=1 Tax=Puia sp. TaxID=2045100 RepID=UPI002BB94797|nr:hypothetical protein [Puia sp.]HVU98856.1 hypothetical protein [Puia sp.]
MITRENYEEYFLLYVDNELSASAKSAVERFVAGNPDVQEEWETLLQCRVDADPHETFPGKETLLQADLLSYVDGELDAPGRLSVEEFVGRYPSKALELEQLSMTVSQPDLTIVFPHKESLYRSGRRRVVYLPWMRAGVAAAALGLVALLLLMGQHTDQRRVAAAPPPPVKKNVPAVVTPRKPAPLYSTGSDDQGRDKVIAKNDPAGRNPQRKAPVPASVEKTPEVAVQRQEVAQVTTVSTNTNGLITNHAGDPALVAEVKPDLAERTLIKPATTVAAVNIPKEQSSFATQALLEEQQEEETKDMVAAAPAGKSKLRGLLRKVSRTLGKTADRDDDGQKEVLISAFQVALK